jgi:hypothetical protein
MDNYYLGHVDYINHEGLWGRIRPLALVKKRTADGAWIVERVCKPDELGESGLVFWPKIPREQSELDGLYVRFKVEPNLYVRFKVEPNQRAHGPDHDDHIVAADRRNGLSHRVETLGFSIVPEDRLDGAERVLAPSAGRRPGTTVYRRLGKGILIDGPWKVARIDGTSKLCLAPKKADFVVEHDVWRLGAETYHEWKDLDGMDQSVLLVEPEKTGGRVKDLMSDSGLAGWLVAVLKRDNGDKVAKTILSRVSPLLAAATDHLERSRFARIEKALAVLANDEARLSDLVESPRFKELLADAIGREVASRREQIKVAAEEEKKGLLREVEKVRAEIADAERLRAEARANIERDESSIRAAADYLVESRERIIRDFAAFHELIEKASSGSSANGRHPTVTGPVQVSVSKGTGDTPDGPAIDDQSIFLQRLARTMVDWGAEATAHQARRFHAALLSCRWVAVPCPSWGVAYAEAMGRHARQRIVTVEPTWLRFSDAWGSDVEAFWREAVENPDILYLLIFADTDRALVQCWARPLLDIVSSVRSLLPAPAGLRWPENLRIISCPSADEAALHVPNWVVAHWAGLEASSGGTRPDGPIPPGHVSFAVWSGWVVAPDGVARPSPKLGIASRSAARERSALARTLEQLSPHDDPVSLQDEALMIREVNARKVFKREDRG